MYDVVVVGGGAAGMLAALTAARSGARTAIIERNEKLGKKLYITGKGRCNLTNSADPEQTMRNIVRNPRFLYASLSNFSNADTVNLFESLGVPLKEERGGRIFPESDKSSDILRALERALRGENVDIILNMRVSSIDTSGGAACGIVMREGPTIRAGRVILATGGSSYPATGSTGDGWAMARALGHEVLPPRAALAPVETVETWPYDLSGLTLKNVAIRASLRGKKNYYDQGELLFTHFGLSGPMILTLSSRIEGEVSGTEIHIDLKPALDHDMLDRRLIRDLAESSKRNIMAVMNGLAPHSLAAKLVVLAGLDASMKSGEVSAAQRRAIIEVLKDTPLTIARLRGMDEAIITRGGVNTREINPSTMESKLTKNLYFAGEMIDVDALTGGFNLQIAFSTGALAGKSAALRKDVEA